MRTKEVEISVRIDGAVLTRNRKVEICFNSDNVECFLGFEIGVLQEQAASLAAFCLRHAGSLTLVRRSCNVAIVGIHSSDRAFTAGTN